MKIKHIKISNALSFKYYENFSYCPQITFEKNSENHDFHIMIGANGSGKSNFLEIINQLLQKNLFKFYKLDISKITPETDENSARQNKQVLHNEELTDIKIPKNWHSKDKDQKIELCLSFNEIDKTNVLFIATNFEKIVAYIHKFSPEGISSINDILTALSSEKDFINNLISKNDLTLIFKTYDPTNNLSISTSNNTAIEKFLLLYLKYYQLIQKIIIIHNIIKKPHEENWLDLKNTFSLLSSYRNYHSISPYYNANNSNESVAKHKFEKQKKNEKINQTDNNEPSIFNLIKHELSYAYQSEYHIGGDKYAKSEIEEFELYKKINAHLKFLGIQFDFTLERPNDWTFKLDVQKDGETIPSTNLSAGEKSFIHLIFELYAGNLEDGMLIIDEPELHLHPQLQKKYLEILYEHCSVKNIQFIIVTHSPLLVTEKNIHCLKRFYFDEKEKTTKLVCPPIEENENLLIQFLDYSNSSKIFFVNTLILVEGHCDEYFFKYYIENHFSNTKVHEILKINSKDAYTKWKNFLSKWKINAYYICDWDNVVDFSIINNSDLISYKEEIQEELIKKINVKISDKKSLDGKKTLETLITYLQNQNEENLENVKKFIIYLSQRHTPYRKLQDLLKSKKLLNEVNNKIEEKYSENIFILKKGELDDYLDITKCNLEKVIDYCKSFNINDFPHKDEIDNILNKIFLNKTKKYTTKNYKKTISC